MVVDHIVLSDLAAHIDALSCLNPSLLLSGTGYMGSTNKAIAALKATFQTPVYPLLDQVRSALGAKIDAELAHLKVCATDSSHACQ